MADFAFPSWLAPQPMGKGPAGGPWTADQERDFQNYMAFDKNVRSWRSGFATKFGEQPMMDDPGFDYRKAYRAGDGPRPYAHDTMYHWGSTGKAPDHPSAWMERFGQQFGGADPHEVTKWTPEMQDFMRREIGGLTIRVGQ